MANAAPAANVRYSVQPAEATDFPAASFDAVCIAQALHWLDLARFWPEVRRVLRPRGVIAAWGYGWMQVEPAIDAALRSGLVAEVKSYWPEQNAKLWRGYRDLEFPFERIEAPAFAIEVDWTLEQAMAYLGSWSAVQRHIAAQGPGVLERAREALAPLWGSGARRGTMAIALLCGRLA